MNIEAEFSKQFRAKYGEETEGEDYFILGWRAIIKVSLSGSATEKT